MYILVVDNEKDIADMLKSLLEVKTKYRIDAVYGGKEALEKMKSQKPDLVTMDIMMPDMDGIEVCKNMVKDEDLKDIPVVLISALPVHSQGFKNSQKKFKELGVVKDVIQKPFSNDEIVAKVNAILGGK